MKESPYRFRVWDDFGKEMYYFDFCTNIEVRNGRLWVVHSEGAICLDYVPPTHVMQYTTHKDKKMQWIYDGDILRREGCWDVRIEFEKGVFWVRDANKVRYNNKILNTSIASFQIETFEIIGNIWQNPELLEKTIATDERRSRHEPF